MTTKSLNLFLEKFSKHLGKRKAIIIIDNAKSKRLKILDNIQIVYLPPYSPELNPVERVFQDIKKAFKKQGVLPDRRIGISLILKGSIVEESSNIH